MRTEPCWRCIDAIIDMRICDHFFLSFASEALDAARYLRASKLAEVGATPAWKNSDVRPGDDARRRRKARARDGEGLGLHDGLGIHLWTREVAHQQKSTQQARQTRMGTRTIARKAAC